MSGEIDLREIEKEALADLAQANIEETQTASSAFLVRRLRNRATRQLALVRAVRAAKVLNETPASVNNWKALDAALSPFTDSAEVRSDGE